MLAHIHGYLMERCRATNPMGGGGCGFVEDGVFVFFHVCVLVVGLGVEPSPLID